MITENKGRLTRERLDELLRFDPATGHFYWRKKRGKTRAGTQAGTLNDNGYVIIGVDYRRYRAHHLVWLHLHGDCRRSSSITSMGCVTTTDQRTCARSRVGSMQKINNAAYRICLVPQAFAGQIHPTMVRRDKNGTVREPLGQFHKRSDAFAACWAALKSGTISIEITVATQCRGLAGTGVRSWAAPDARYHEPQVGDIRYEPTRADRNVYWLLCLSGRSGSRS